MIGIHDPSTVIKCDGNYYVFGTGRGISVLTSSNGFDWQRGGRVFDRIPDSVKSFVPKNDGQSVWAPDITRLNGQYYLYYAVSAVGRVRLGSRPGDQPDAEYKRSQLQMDGSRHGGSFRRGGRSQRD